MPLRLLSKLAHWNNHWFLIYRFLKMDSSLMKSSLIASSKLDVLWIKLAAIASLNQSGIGVVISFGHQLSKVDCSRPARLVARNSKESSQKWQESEAGSFIGIIWVRNSPLPGGALFSRVTSWFCGHRVPVGLSLLDSFFPLNLVFGKNRSGQAKR